MITAMLVAIKSVGKSGSPAEYVVIAGHLYAIKHGLAASMRAALTFEAGRSFLDRGARSDAGRHDAMIFAATTLLDAANWLYYSLEVRVVDVSDCGALMSLMSLALIVTALFALTSGRDFRYRIGRTPRAVGEKNET